MGASKIFTLLKKNNRIVAPISGKVIDLKSINDKVFSEKLAGDGVAIEPTGNVIVAPADGTLSLVFKTGHAFSMKLSNGVELLVHIGLDTVELEGKGFEILVKEKKIVKCGQPIIKIDRDWILEKGYSLTTPVIITNPDTILEIKGNIGEDVEVGQDTIFTYRIK